MKIATLIENKPGDREELYTEYGLSIYIEVDGKKILFDTGQSGDFIDNAKDLGIDLKGLDYVIISHGHYDHSGGFERLIKEINPSINLYLGNPFEEQFLSENNIQVKYINEDILNIRENLIVFTNFNRNQEFENTNQNMYLKEDEEYKKDMFLEEVSLGIKTNKGLVVIVGCSHAGIVNILDTITERIDTNIYGVIGGIHLIKENDEKINKIIEYLKEKDIELIGACHCTGKQGETMLSQRLKGSFIDNNTGDTLYIK